MVLSGLELQESSLALRGKKIKLKLANTGVRTLGRSHFLSQGSDVLPDLSEVDLSGNPLVCDCDLVWLATLARDANVTARAVCQSPSRLAGQSLADIPASDLEVCQGDGDDDRANTVLLVLRSVEDKVSESHQCCLIKWDIRAL